MRKRDGHIHTPFCPHGSGDSLDKYITKAIDEGFTEITFTEHAPLPISFIDPTPEKDCGMKHELLTAYFGQLQELKERYKKHIIINIGLEIDYIVGFEHSTRNFLNEVGPMLDDAILSVHFLQHTGNYTCIDFSEDVYLQFSEQIGGIEAMYDLYYETVKQSIIADLGPYKPKRIGHPTLIHKFQLAHNQSINDRAQIESVLQLMQTHGYELDFNSAGLSKTYCQEPYPNYEYAAFAKQIGVPIVFGSDAHTAKDLHQHYNALQQKLTF
ncbi:histidinol-phosphatase HisJ [Solibacillus daqui]|uniref:histidinol-phosphatase HisJ n=1 Tax=Solibacillus daqui TaxID=2912187 RepID=UPI002365664F|nr:histidinol-phosphatase HisJ [Solibacillus daqui]